MVLNLGYPKVILNGEERKWRLFRRPPKNNVLVQEEKGWRASAVTYPC